MKIGIVLAKTPAYSETFFISKIKGLQRNGFEVVLFVQAAQSEFNLCSVRIAPKFYKYNPILQVVVFIKVMFWLLVYYKRVKSFYKLKRKSGCHVMSTIKAIYFNTHILKEKLDWLHFGFGTMALGREQLAKAIGAKMAVSFRGYDLDVFPLKHKNVYNTLWKYVDNVHVLSNYLLKQAYYLGMPKHMTYSVITPALKLLDINTSVNKNDKLKIITVARLHWIKGLHYILEALNILKNQGLKFSYSLVGEGDEYESLKFTIHQLDLQDNVLLLGKKSHNETLELMSKANVYIQYSLSEGFGNAALEAQGLGLLTVVSDGGALAENVIHNKTGWVVPKNSPKLLAERLENILKLSEVEKNQIINQAKKRVINQFSLKKQINEFKEFYSNQ